MMIIAPSRQAIVDAILRHIADTGVSPTYREIADSINLSKSTVCAHIEKMRDEGILDFQDGKCRSIRILAITEEL